MKRYLLLGIIFLAGLTVYSQECENYIELIGIGIADSIDGASIDVPDYDQVDFIVAEAIYKAPAVPSAVRFWTDIEDVTSPYGVANEIPISGEQTTGWYTSVFREELKPAPVVHLDFLANIDAFYSLALYLHKKDGSVYSMHAGELYHVYHNGPDGQVTNIPIPVSTQLRDITIRFGITELNADSREAIFTFAAGGVEETEIVNTWVVDEGTTKRSYIILEVLLEDVPGATNEITMTMLSETSGGDSWVAGVVLVDLPCEEYEFNVLCSYTQGYYGNKGGKTCDGKTTTELLESLLLTDPLVVGGADNSFTIGTVDDGGPACVLDLLPGGGPSSVLTGHTSCGTIPEEYTNKQGRLTNTLLAQAITLSLNVRNSPDLLTFPADGTIFTTWMAEDCTDPLSGGIAGTEMEYSFSQEILEGLPGNATIGDLLALVNKALDGGNISSLSLSQVSDAATLVNEAFDECVIVKGNMSSTGEMTNDEEDSKDEESTMKGITSVTGHGSDNALGIYPNPVMDKFYLSIPSQVTNVRSAGIYSMTGVKMKSVVNKIESGKDQVVEIDASDLLQGIYFVRIESDAGSLIKRFGVQ